MNLTPAEIVSLSNDGRTDADTPTSLQTAATDSDSDGLPDLWEEFYFPGDLGQLGSAPADKDNDGMTDAEELMWGFNPNNSTDASTDADADGVANGVEIDNGTDPQDSDSDNDGLIDGVETGTGIYVSATDTGTDPLLADTDGDLVDDGTELAYNTDPSSAIYRPTLLAWWDFNNDSNSALATDSRVGRLANFAGSAVYTADAGGQSGTTGDKAVTTNGGSLNSPLATWLNIGTSVDKLTVMFWQKRDSGAIGQSSTFYINASSAERGMQSHLPWTDGTVYYDTGGSGGAGIRVSGVPSPANTWDQWHHYTFVKDGGRKTFYIDGVEKLNQASGALPLKTDFYNLNIGQGLNGQIDDFAVFATAVSQSDILDITNRVKTPAQLEDADMDGLIDTWEYANFPTDLTKLSAAGNLDGDGLLDAEELAAGTDPNDADTDDDGLQDEVENGSGMWVNLTNTGTNPLVADTDGDSFPDGVENNSGLWVSQTNPGTNPNLADTDSDGFADFVEGPNGYEPSDDASLPDFKEGKYLMAYWKFDDASLPAVTVDEVNNHTGVVTGTYSAEGEGATLSGTDRAMCIGAGQSVQVDGSFTNLATAENKITISFWQKINSVISSSSFWIESASSGGRGIQAHSPYSGGLIYFDHSGCCTNNQTRINSGDLRGTGPGQIAVGEWQHYAYVKDGDDKRVYIDGIEVLSGLGVIPLVYDFADLYIGSANDGGSIDGCIDEFAIFAGALSPYQITQLAAGTSADTVLDANSIYQAWASTNSLTPGVNDGINQDPDLDGRNNLLEFAFGTNPQVADAAPVTFDFTPPFSPTNVNVQFVRRVDPSAAGLTYIVEFSADLSDWEQSTDTPAFVSTQSTDYEVVNIPYMVFLTSGKKATYFRLRVNSSETSGINP